MTSFIARIYRSGCSLVVTIPESIIEFDNLNIGDLIELELNRIKRNIE